MVVSLNVKDRRILLALYEDGRASTSAIARKARVSQEVAFYRLKRLREQGILLRVIPIVDYSALGYSSYRLQLRFRPMDKAIKDEFMAFVKGIPALSWLVLLSESWDLVLLFNVRTAKEFADIYEGIMAQFGSVIDEKLFTVVTGITHLAPTYLLSQERWPLTTKDDPRNIVLDENSRKALRLLFEDARMPLVDMARKMQVSVTTAKYHLDRLEKDKVILGYRPVLDVKALGYAHAKVLLELENPADRKAVQELLLQDPHVVYITTSLGRYDIEFECEYGSANDVIAFMEGIRARIHVRRHDIIYKNEEVLINEVPGQ